MENTRCIHCGKEFEKKSYQQKFCCKTCKEKYWKKERHSNGYYRKYNKEHPERLERGFTKGFNNGNVSEGKKCGNYSVDSLGRVRSNDFFNPTLTDLIEQKCYGTWHDDDWCEDDD